MEDTLQVRISQIIQSLIKMMKTLVKKISLKDFLSKLSRFVYYLTPKEKKEDSLMVRLQKQKAEEVWEVFSIELKRRLRFYDMKSIRNYAINLNLYFPYILY